MPKSNSTQKEAMVPAPAMQASRLSVHPSQRCPTGSAGSKLAEVAVMYVAVARDTVPVGHTEIFTVSLEDRTLSLAVSLST